MTFKHKLSKRLALSRVAVVIAMAACTGTDLGSPVIAERDAVALKIHPQQVSILPGQSVTFTPYAFVVSGDSIPIPVDWDATGGSVTPEGLFQSDSSPGTHVVTATPRARPDLAASALIQVGAAGDAVLRIHPRDVVVWAGDSIEFSAYAVSGDDSSLTTVEWSATQGLMVDQGEGRGKLKVTGSGAVRVNARGGGKRDSTTVTVQPRPVAAVLVTPEAASVVVGQAIQLEAVPVDSLGGSVTGRTITWESQAAGIATVDDAGRVVGVAQGTAVVTATVDGHIGAATITVSQVPVASVGVRPSTLSLTAGQTAQLTTTVLDFAGNVLNGRTVTWATSAAAVATVATSGLVTAVGAGVATITATSEGKSAAAVVTVTTVTGCSTSLGNVSLPLCDGTYSQSISPSTFPAHSVIQAQNPGKVRFTGSFSAGNDLTFRGVVIVNASQKSLGSRTVYEDMSFVGGPACGNTVNSLSGSNTTIRRSAFYGRGGRYLFLPWRVSGVVLEDVMFRTDGGWGEGGSGCNGYEPNAALNVYDSPSFTCINCILFDGIVTASGESETLGGLGVNCHESASDAVFRDNVIVNSRGGFWADGMGTCDGVVIQNSAAFRSGDWGLKRHVDGTTTAINLSTDTNCGGWKGTTALTDSRIGGVNDGCVGGTAGAGATIQLNTTFLDNPRWRQEMCTDAGVARGWCGTSQNLSTYLRSYF